MSKEKHHSPNFDTHWNDIWQKQSRLFFESAHNALNTFLDKSKEPYMHPEKQMEQVKQWLEILKAQWQALYDQEKMDKNYWQVMNKLYLDASHLFLAQWVKRMREQHFIKNIQELYDLWLACCQAAYMKNMQSGQKEMVTEWMDAFFNYWERAKSKM